MRASNERAWMACVACGVRIERPVEGATSISPWEAVQRAAGDALYKLRAGEAAQRDWTTTNDAPA